MAHARQTYGDSEPASMLPPLMFVPWLILGATYGLLSSPTPDRFGTGEILVGGLLIATVGLRALHKLASLAIPGGIGRDRGIADLMVVVLVLVVPLATGFLRGNRVEDMIRDLVPAVYFLVPLLVVTGTATPSWLVPALASALLVAGSGFAARHLLSGDFALNTFGEQTYFGSIDYFVLDPAVLFTGAFGLALFVMAIIESRSPVLILAGACLATVPAVAIGATVIRSQIAVLVIVGLFCMGRSFRISLATLFGMALALSALVAGYAVFGDRLAGLVELIGHKQQAVGLANGRELEIRAVWSEMTAGYDLFLFGKGWGGTIVHPLGLAGQEWRFVHIFPFYLLMKVGLAGSILLAPLLLRLAGTARFMLVSPEVPLTERAMALGCIASLSINLTVSAGFKMLGLGLVMALLLALFARRRSALAPDLPPVLPDPTGPKEAAPDRARARPPRRIVPQVPPRSALHPPKSDTRIPEGNGTPHPRVRRGNRAARNSA